jgi:hypothetical protein
LREHGLPPCIPCRMGPAPVRGYDPRVGDRKSPEYLQYWVNVSTKGKMQEQHQECVSFDTIGQAPSCDAHTAKCHVYTILYIYIIYIYADTYTCL